MAVLEGAHAHRGPRSPPRASPSRVASSSARASGTSRSATSVTSRRRSSTARTATRTRPPRRARDALARHLRRLPPGASTPLEARRAAASKACSTARSSRRHASALAGETFAPEARLGLACDSPGDRIERAGLEPEIAEHGGVHGVPRGEAGRVGVRHVPQGNPRDLAASEPPVELEAHPRADRARALRRHGGQLLALPHGVDLQHLPPVREAREPQQLLAPARPRDRGDDGPRELRRLP